LNETCIQNKNNGINSQNQSINTNSENNLLSKNSCIGIKHDKNKELLYKWNIGTINIRTGDEKSEGARMYMVAKQVAEANLLVCSLQEVRYRNDGKKKL
jgi:hypothetical protein